jgi:hypothetical protein
VDELRRCQRYCYTEFNNPFDGTFPRTNDIPNSGSSQIALAAYHSSSVYMYVSKFPVFMRITPSATFGLVNTFPASYVQQDSGTTYNVSSFSLQHASKDQAIVNLNTAPNGAIAVSFLRRNHSLSHVLYWRFDAEL